jgi:hypothetical protein
MKSLIKNIFLFFLLIALLILIPKISIANALTCSPNPANPCTITGHGNKLDTMCVKFKTTVTVKNLPAGKNVYLACDGDYGEGWVRNKQPSTTATDASIACGGRYCNGDYGGCTEQNWCEGEIKTAITGSSTGPVSRTSQAIDLTHCSCTGVKAFPGQPNSQNLGCLQVSVSSSPPTMANACDNSHKPTVVGVTKDIPVDCNVSINDAPACYVNGSPAHSDIVTVNCPAPPPTTTPVPPTCSATHYNCAMGGSSGTTGDTTTQWKWNCTHLGNTVACTEDKPVCSATHYNCAMGGSSGTTGDTTTQWKWNCTHLGNTVACTEDKPVAPTLTPVPPTLTPVPPTATPVPPTATPIPTLVPGHTVLHFTIGLDAIGHTGDQVNADWRPINAACANQDPITNPRNFTITVGTTAYNNQSFTFDATNGVYVGTVDLGTSFVSGDYTITVTADGHLTRRVPGSVTITAETPKDVSRVNLVTGDINMDNQLSILDYNILMSCLNDPDINPFDHTLCNSNPDFIKRANLEDNGVNGVGVVDKFDYNLFVREFSKVQNGDPIPTPTPTVTAAVTPTVTATPTITPTTTTFDSPLHTSKYFIFTNVNACYNSTCTPMTYSQTQVDTSTQNFNAYVNFVNTYLAGKMTIIPRVVVISDLKTINFDDLGSINPDEAQNLIGNQVDKNIDFVFLTAPTPHPQYCGLSYFEGNHIHGVGGSTYAFIYPGCASGGMNTFIHESTNQMRMGLELVMKRPDMYDIYNGWNGGVYPQSLCGNTNPAQNYDWFPNPETADKVPDFPACAHYYGHWPEYCSASFTSSDACGQAFYQSVISNHFPANITYTGNHCRNGIKDFDETGVDTGSNCLDHVLTPP